ncbi:MAG: GAF domain-containing protein [Leptospirillum sp.]
MKKTGTVGTGHDGDDLNPSHPLGHLENIRDDRGQEDLKKELRLLRGLLRITHSESPLEERLDLAIRLSREILNFDVALIYLLDEEKTHLVLKASSLTLPGFLSHFSLRLGEGLTGWVARERSPVIISKKAWLDPRFKTFPSLSDEFCEAFISIPLVAKDRLLGVMNFQFKETYEPSEREVELLVILALELSLVIDHVLLFEEARKKARQIEALSQVSESITSSRYLEEILHLIVTVTAEMTSSTLCSLMIYDAEEGLVIRATQTLSQEYRNKPPIKIGESISGLVFRDGRPIWVENVQADPRYSFKDLAKKENLVSLLSVPMMIKNRPIGVINVYTSKVHRFSEDEITVLQTVANQAAIAWENTSLLQKNIEMEEALESRKKIDRAKSILMKANHITEDEAYRLLQKKSMNIRKSMKEIAEAILLAHDLKEG